MNITLSVIFQDKQIRQLGIPIGNVESHVIHG